MTRSPLCALPILAAMCLIAVAAAAQNSTAPSDDLAGAPRISMSEFKALLARGDVLVLDVRDVQSYKNAHIPGARSLPLAEVASRASSLRAERRPIVTYCA